MRKAFLISILAIVFASCATQKNNTYYVDYAPLTKAGLYVSPSTVVPENYTAIGEIFIEQQSGTKSSNSNLKKDAFNESNHGMFDRKKTPEGNSSNFVRYDSNTILSELANKIKEKGGDGVVGLSIKYIEPTYTIQGYIIKRK